MFEKDCDLRFGIQSIQQLLGKLEIENMLPFCVNLVHPLMKYLVSDTDIDAEFSFLQSCSKLDAAFSSHAWCSRIFSNWKLLRSFMGLISSGIQVFSMTIFWRWKYRTIWLTTAKLSLPANWWIWSFVKRIASVLVLVGFFFSRKATDKKVPDIY